MTQASPYRPYYALVDSSAYYALAHSRQENHPAARAIADRLARERWRLFTTNFILAETHALILIRLNRVVALQVLSQIEQSPTTIIRVTAADEARARAILRQYQDKAFSLTDATSFAVMERLGISQAFSFDRNFAQYGFPALQAE
jgi:predicted nucleic acid-binding protein